MSKTMRKDSLLRIYFQSLSVLVCIIGVTLFLFATPIMRDLFMSDNINRFNVIYFISVAVFGCYCLYVSYGVLRQFSPQRISNLNTLLLFLIFMLLPVEMKHFLSIKNREDELFCYLASFLIGLLVYRLNKYFVTRLDDNNHTTPHRQSPWNKRDQ